MHTLDMAPQVTCGWRTEEESEHKSSDGEGKQPNPTQPNPTQRNPTQPNLTYVTKIENNYGDEYSDNYFKLISHTLLQGW